MRRAQRCCGSESSWRASSRRTYLSTAPLSACVNAAVGLAERTSCSTCCTRGCCRGGGGAAGPVNTTVPTTPETRAQTHKADALHAHGGGAEGRREGGDLPWLHCSSSLGKANLKASRDSHRYHGSHALMVKTLSILTSSPAMNRLTPPSRPVLPPCSPPAAPALRPGARGRRRFERHLSSLSQSNEVSKFITKNRS